MLPSSAAGTGRAVAEGAGYAARVPV